MRLRRVADPDDALRRFARRERGYVDMIRMERLCEQLRLVGAITVRSNTWALSGNLARIVLDDGMRLRLWLFWRSDQALAAIERAWFDDDIGWIVLARSVEGDLVQLFAYKIRLDPIALDPSPARGTRRAQG